MEKGIIANKINTKAINEIIETHNPIRPIELQTKRHDIEQQRLQMYRILNYDGAISKSWKKKNQKANGKLLLESVKWGL